MASVFTNPATSNQFSPVTFIQSAIADLYTTLGVPRQRSSRRRAAVAIGNRTLTDIGLVRAQIHHESG